MATTATRSPADEILPGLLGTEEGRQDRTSSTGAARHRALFRRQLDGHWYASGDDDCKASLVDPRAGRGPGMLTRYGQNPALAERFARRMRLRRGLPSLPVRVRPR